MLIDVKEAAPLDRRAAFTFSGHWLRLLDRLQVGDDMADFLLQHLLVCDALRFLESFPPCGHFADTVTSHIFNATNDLGDFIVRIDAIPAFGNVNQARWSCFQAVGHRAFAVPGIAVADSAI